MAGLGEMVKGKGNVGDLLGTLLYSGSQLHMMHLMTGSYANHIALNELYDELPGLIDTVAEEYQGVKGSIDFTGAKPLAFTSNPIKFLDEVYKVTEDLLASCRIGHIRSNVEIIQTAIAKTLYKLKTLK